MAKAKVNKPKSATRTKAPPAAAKPPKRAAAVKAAPAKAATPAKPPKPAKATKVTKVAESAKKVAKNPAAAEVVAATLVAAAAALRNPKKAQALALEAADDIKRAAKSGINSGEAMWQLALDVARRSIDALGPDKGKKGKSKKKK